MLEWKAIGHDYARKFVAQGMDWSKEYPDIAPVMAYIYDPDFESLTVSLETRAGGDRFSITAQITGVGRYGIKPEAAALMAEAVDRVFQHKHEENSQFIPLLLRDYRECRMLRTEGTKMETQTIAFAALCAEIFDTCAYLMSLDDRAFAQIGGVSVNQEEPDTPAFGGNIVSLAAFRKKAAAPQPQRQEFVPLIAELVRNKDRYPLLSLPPVYNQAPAP